MKNLFLKVTNKETGKQFVEVSKNEIEKFLYENIEMSNNYSLCLGEDGELFYKQDNTGFQNYDYIVLTKCGIDYRDYDDGEKKFEDMTEEEKEIAEKEIKDFIISTTIEELGNEIQSLAYDIELA